MPNLICPNCGCTGDECPDCTKEEQPKDQLLYVLRFTNDPGHDHYWLDLPKLLKSLKTDYHHAEFWFSGREMDENTVFEPGDVFDVRGTRTLAQVEVASIDGGAL